ncbi:MAG: hypothetical protein ACFFBP_05300 [Promethearchaeota archaeon]
MSEKETSRTKLIIGTTIAIILVEIFLALCLFIPAGTIFWLEP